MWRPVFLIRGVLLVWLANVGESLTIEELESMVNRHSTTLRQISPYLVRTDQFWRWYTRNHRRLNTMMAGRETAVPTSGEQLEEISQRLHRIETELQEGNAEREVGQHRRLRNLEEAVVRLTANLTATNLENEALRREIELGGQDVDKVLMFVRQMSIVSNNTGQTLKNQVRTLSQRVAKMEENAAAKESASTEKENNMLTEISQIKERLMAVEEDQKVTTEINAFLNNSVISINEQMGNITDKAKQFSAIESRLNLLRDKMESFERVTNDRTRRGMQEISESKILTLEGQLSSTREDLHALAEQTRELRSQHENASNTRNEIVKINNQLQNLQTQSQNTGTRFTVVQRSVESMGSEIVGIRSSLADIDGRLNNARNLIDGVRNSVNLTQRDVTSLKDQVESIRTPAASLDELRDKVAEIEKKVEAKSSIRIRGDELLNSITSGASATAGQPPPHVSNLNIPGLDHLPRRLNLQ
ncbi:hypothetical protein FHG87_009100 [Trinorchestia longiramus]|nr:hypothetical protein FHG87_009100 [Trinorchestia longiramus]